MKTGIVICFPGTGFTCKEALFERCAERLQRADTIRSNSTFRTFRFAKSKQWKKRFPSRGAR